MKTHHLTIITTNLALAASLTLLTGCLSKNYDKGTATATALKSSTDAVAQTSSHLYNVMGALNNLTTKSPGDLRDLRGQYDTLVAATASLDHSMASLDSSVAAVHAKADAYLNNWTNQTAMIQNDDLRLRSGERKAEVSGKLNEVTVSYDGLKKSYKPFAADLKDIQTYLGMDLTADGLVTVKDVVAKVKEDVEPVRYSIKQLHASFSSLSTALSPELPAGE